MSKNNLYLPLKFVPYIFISITAILITAATYVITWLSPLNKFFESFRKKIIYFNIDKDVKKTKEEFILFESNLVFKLMLWHIKIRGILIN